MPKLILYLVCLLTISCSAHSRPDIPYADFLNEVKQERARLKQKPIKDCQEYFFRLIHEKIPAYWKGTPWDFNGTTRTPGQGNIACGYFITNTLTDLGFSIERIKLAQAASSVLIKTVCTDIHYFASYEKLENWLKTAPPNSVYIVGLDFHTGYITKDEKQAWFIHSNYIQRRGVTKEKIHDSAALQSSKTFMLGSITANTALLEQWVKGS